MCIDLPIILPSDTYLIRDSRILHQCSEDQKHEPYIQSVATHLNGGKCSSCTLEYLTKLFTKSPEKYLEECEELDLDPPIEPYIRSDEKIKHICCNGHEYLQTPQQHLTQRHSCPKCRNKSEIVFSKELSKITKTFELQISFEWCKNFSTGRYLPFDFVIPEYNLIIELDGSQHFRDVLAWKSYSKKQCENDVYKMQRALEQNYTVIRVEQEYAKKYKNDVSNILKDKLFLREYAMILYIAKRPDTYNNHEILLASITNNVYIQETMI